MASTFRWIGRTREREIIRRSLDHLYHVIRATEAFEQMVKAFVVGDREVMNDRYRAVFNEEREADNVKKSVIMDLSRGMFHPIDREDLIRLILTADDIAANVKAAARKLLLIEEFKVSEPLATGLLRMAAKAVEAVRMLKEAVAELAEDPARALDKADAVERLEEEVDEIRTDVTAMTLRAASTDIFLGNLILLKEVIDNMEAAVDRCEDTADIVRTIAVLLS